LEDVNITLIHEIAHIVYETFEKVSGYERANILRNAIKAECNGQSESSRAAKLAKKLDTAPDLLKQDYLNLLQFVSPFMPVLFNAAEDVRVNGKMQSYLPGTRIMFNAQINKIFKHGIEQHDGQVKMWSDAQPNSQAIIAVYCKVSNLDYQDWLAPEVVAGLDDPALDTVCADMAKAKSARAIYRLCYPLLENLRRLGFCKSPDDPEDDPQSESEEDEEGKGATGETPGDSDQSTAGGSAAGSSGGKSGEAMGSGGGSHSDNSEESPGTEASADKTEPDSGTGPDDTDESDDSSGSVESEDKDQDGSNSSESDTEDPIGADNTEDTDEAGADTDASTSQDQSSGPYNAAPWVESPEMGDDSTDSDSGPQIAVKDEEPSVSEVPEEPYTDADMERDGTPDEMERLLNIFGGHAEKNEESEEPKTYKVRLEEAEMKQAIERAVEQVAVFDRPSINIGTLKLIKYGEQKEGYYGSPWSTTRGRASRTMPEVPERILISALQKLRLAFQDNKRAYVERNRKSGKIDTRVLGKRIATNDDRLFIKKTQPVKKDYFVVVGLDCSGSTGARPHDRSFPCRLDLMKAACFAKCELLHRLGVEFAVYGHSGDLSAVEIFQIKGPDEKWGVKQKEALATLQPYSANLDGHTLEFYRKVAQASRATDKVILYYTDGHMPLENYAEELVILQDEIKTCARAGIKLVGIGVETDAPADHGLDTIRLDGINDIPAVVEALRKRLS